MVEQVVRQLVRNRRCELVIRIVHPDKFRPELNPFAICKSLIAIRGQLEPRGAGFDRQDFLCRHVACRQSPGDHDTGIGTEFESHRPIDL